MSDHDIDRVLTGNYCIGCGVCARHTPDAFTVSMNEYGCYQAVIRAREQSSMQKASEVCPFSNQTMNEDVLASECFPGAEHHLEGVGRHVATYAGYVTDAQYRLRGSSGGMASWIAAELLRRNEVDGIIHVKPGPQRGPLFQYGISRSVDELLDGAKSKYYPVELSRVLAQIEQTEGRFAITALPCFAKALRNFMRLNPGMRQKLPYIIGLFCGHLKSARFADSIAMQVGIQPGTVEQVDFRLKLAGRSAADYGVEVKARTPEGLVTRRADNRQLYGSDWGLGFFKYSACEYCDDVTAEVADISIGDAWLEPYVRDERGTNILVVRHREMDAIIREGMSDGRLCMDAISAQAVYESQRAGINHRREGLSYRLHLKQQAREWVMNKRVAPTNFIDRNRKAIYRMRLDMVRESHQAFAEALSAGNFDVFRHHMDPYLSRYRDYYVTNRWRRLGRRLKRMTYRILGETIARHINALLKPAALRPTDVNHAESRQPNQAKRDR